MTRKILVLLMSLISVSLISTSYAAEFDTKFGILTEVNGDLEIAKETSDIPYIFREQGQIFGIEISTSSSTPYRYYSISYLPGPPQLLEGYDSAIEPEDYEGGLRSQEHELTGKSVHVFYLTKGDHLGDYRIEVFINDSLLETIEFKVAEL